MAKKRKKSDVLGFARDIYDESAVRRAAGVFKRWADVSIAQDAGLFMVTIAPRPGAGPIMDNLPGEFANRVLSFTKRCL